MDRWNETDYTNRNFMKSLAEMHHWTRKFPFNFGSYPKNADFRKGQTIPVLTTSHRPTSDQISMVVLLEICLSKLKFPSNFWSHPESADLRQGPAIPHLTSGIDEFNIHIFFQIFTPLVLIHKTYCAAVVHNGGGLHFLSALVIVVVVNSFPPFIWSLTKFDIQVFYGHSSFDS